MATDLSHSQSGGGVLPTVTDPMTQLRALGDPVIGLRIWGTNLAHVFPAKFERLTLGRDPTNDIVIDHETVSRRHATIEWRGPHLVVVHQGGKNPTWSGGQEQGIFQLTGGATVRFGAVEVVAVSARMQTIRAGFQRFLGISHANQSNVDAAQLAAEQRRHLALVGPAASVRFARFIHDTTPNNTWPFVVAPAKLPTDKPAQKALVAGAAYGMLAIAADTLIRWRAPRAPFLLELLATDAYHVRLVVLAEPGANLEAAVGDALRSRLAVITGPALKARRGELAQLVAERVAHHAARVGATQQLLGPGEIARLHAIDWPGGYDELEDAIERLVFLRTVGTNEAERRLGLGSGTLSKWVRRHRFTAK